LLEFNPGQLAEFRGGGLIVAVAHCSATRLTIFLVVARGTLTNPCKNFLTTC
jgi:hypothetical protein